MKYVFAFCEYNTYSSRSSGQVRGAEKHEIYAAAFSGHLFYDLFSQGQGGMAPSPPPPDPLLTYVILIDPKWPGNGERESY